MKRLIFNSLTAHKHPHSIEKKATRSKGFCHKKEISKNTYKKRRIKKAKTAIFTGKIKYAITTFGLPS